MSIHASCGRERDEDALGTSTKKGDRLERNACTVSNLGTPKREVYRPNLAVLHFDGLNTMSADEAAFAVDHLIRPVTVIPEHLNQASTSAGVVVPGTRLDACIKGEHSAKIIVPLSGMPISCDGEGNCTGAGTVNRDRVHGYDHDNGHGRGPR